MLSKADICYRIALDDKGARTASAIAYRDISDLEAT